MHECSVITHSRGKSYHDLAIPNFAELKETYAAKWNRKTKVSNQLKCNFAMVERQAEGKQRFLCYLPQNAEKIIYSSIF